MNKTIYIPSSAVQTRKMLRCHFCSKSWPESQRPQFDRHIKAELKKHRDEMLHRAEELDNNLITGVGDREMFKFAKDWEAGKIRKQRKNW